MSERQHVENKPLDLYRVCVLCLHVCATRRIPIGNLLLRDMERQAKRRTARDSLQEVHVEDVNRGVARAIRNSPPSLVARASSSGRSEYPIIESLPSMKTKLPSRSCGPSLGIALLEISDSPRMCWPMNCGSAMATSGLSTWK